MRHLVAVVLVGAATVAQAAPAPRTLPGWPLYERQCSACHGADGDGRGPAAPFTWGRPRAFAEGQYEWRTTPIGSPPTDDDLRLAIRRGVAGTSMPAFRFGAADLDALVVVLKAFAPAAFAAPAVPVVLGAASAPDPARGAMLWRTIGCVACHGAGGRGDGPAARGLAEPPYDLVAFPLRRPREGSDVRGAAALSIATGLSGTGMPGFAGAISDADIWALADHVAALGAHGARTDRSAIDDDEIAADRVTKLAVGTWPGPATDPEAAVFGTRLAPQGTPPPGLTPELVSLAPTACARCHPTQHAEWRTSVHGAAVSPGLLAQLDYGLTAAEGETCRRCHAPLDEQRTDLALRATGVSCAGCHVRGFTRHGPPNPAAAATPYPGYPRVAQGLYERADFCLPCHQLPPRMAVNGKPLLDTYKEWLESPFPARGVMCQDCHMVRRAHLWRGVHDRDMFRQAIDLVTTSERAGDQLTVTAELRNRGAGHFLPTTTTPTVWLSIELLDARGTVLPGTASSLRIGRDLTFDGTWHERADTRIPPGGRAVNRHTWRAVPAATAARITVLVQPDAFYEAIYAARLQREQPAPARTLNEQALARARASHYVAEQRVLRLK